MLAFTAAVATGSGLLFGAAPAFQASRTGVAGTLETGRASATPAAGRQRLQRVFVGVEVALAFVLLAGGGLLLNSLARVSRVDPGFRPENLLTMRLTLPRERYRGAQVGAFFQELVRRVEAVPGVALGGGGKPVPPVAFSFQELQVEDAPPRRPTPRSPGPSPPW